MKYGELHFKILFQKTVWLNETNKSSGVSAVMHPIYMFFYHFWLTAILPIQASLTQYFVQFNLIIYVYAIDSVLQYCCFGKGTQCLWALCLGIVEMLKAWGDLYWSLSLPQP